MRHFQFHIVCFTKKKKDSSCDVNLPLHKHFLQYICVPVNDEYVLAFHYDIDLWTFLFVLFIVSACHNILERASALFHITPLWLCWNVIYKFINCLHKFVEAFPVNFSRSQILEFENSPNCIIVIYLIEKPENNMSVPGFHTLYMLNINTQWSLPSFYCPSPCLFV
jgi:hypothetical protein